MVNEKSIFKGKSLTGNLQIGFLKERFGRDFLDEYDKRVKSNYNSNPNLDVLGYNGHVVTDSNPFAVVLANQILREEGLRTATQADLEEAIRIKWLTWDYEVGPYRDTSLILRSEEDKDYPMNTPLAKNLAEQLKAKEIKFTPEIPVMIPLMGFELENANNGYGLTFKLREDAEIYEVPILAKDGKFDKKDINKKIGLPKKSRKGVRKGDRYLHTRNSGLSRLCLQWDLDLFSGWGLLSESDFRGRIIVINSE